MENLILLNKRHVFQFPGMFLNQSIVQIINWITKQPYFTIVQLISSETSKINKILSQILFLLFKEYYIKSNYYET